MYNTQYEEDVISYLASIKEQIDDLNADFTQHRQDIWNIRVSENTIASAIVSGDSYLNSELQQIKETNTGIIIVIVLFIIYYFIMRCLK